MRLCPISERCPCYDKRATSTVPADDRRRPIQNCTHFPRPRIAPLCIFNRIPYQTICITRHPAPPVPPRYPTAAHNGQGKEEDHRECQRPSCACHEVGQVYTWLQIHYQDASFRQIQAHFDRFKHYPVEEVRTRILCHACKVSGSSLPR